MERQVKITYYDDAGLHETKPCSRIEFNCAKVSFPNTDDITIVYRMWYGTEEDGHYERVSVPVSHSIEAV